MTDFKLEFEFRPRRESDSESWQREIFLGTAEEAYATAQMRLSPGHVWEKFDYVNIYNHSRLVAQADREKIWESE